MPYRRYQPIYLWYEYKVRILLNFFFHFYIDLTLVLLKFFAYLRLVLDYFLDPQLFLNFRRVFQFSDDPPPILTAAGEFSGELKIFRIFISKRLV